MNQSIFKKEHLSKQRRGAASVVALAALVLLTMVSALMLKTSLARIELARLEENRLQADWLLEAGLERAIVQLAIDNDYQGETWKIEAESLGGRSAVVQIKVAFEADSDWTEVTIEAVYPAELDKKARKVRVYRIDREPSAKALKEDSR